MTKEDIPALTERREKLLSIIAGIDAGNPATVRENGEIVTDPIVDRAEAVANLTEVEHFLTVLGVELDA